MDEADYEIQLRVKRDEIDRLKSELADRDKVVASLEGALRQRDKDVAELQAEQDAAAINYLDQIGQERSKALAQQAELARLTAERDEILSKPPQERLFCRGCTLPSTVYKQQALLADCADKLRYVLLRFVPAGHPQEEIIPALIRDMEALNKPASPDKEE